jgi:hypothetical protein
MSGSPRPPSYRFERDRNLELNEGLVLAGELIIDRSAAEAAYQIINHLTRQAEAGELPQDNSKLVYGWSPVAFDNRVDTQDRALIEAWRQHSLVIDIRMRHGEDAYSKLIVA